MNLKIKSFIHLSAVLFAAHSLNSFADEKATVVTEEKCISYAGVMIPSGARYEFEEKNPKSISAYYVPAPLPKSGRTIASITVTEKTGKEIKEEKKADKLISSSPISIKDGVCEEANLPKFKKKFSASYAYQCKKFNKSSVANVIVVSKEKLAAHSLSDALKATWKPACKD